MTKRTTDQILADMIKTAKAGHKVIPMYYQPLRGIDACVSAAVRKGLKTGQLVQDGLDGCGKPWYTVPTPTATHAAPVAVQ